LSAGFSAAGVLLDGATDFDGTAAGFAGVAGADLAGFSATIGLGAVGCGEVGLTGAAGGLLETGDVGTAGLGGAGFVSAAAGFEAEAGFEAGAGLLPAVAAAV